MVATEYQRSFNPLPLLLVLLVALLAVAGAVSVKNGRHAVQKHGWEATAIRQACDGDGPVQVWKSSSSRQKDKFFQVCRLPDGRLGIRIIRCASGVWHEITSFVPNGPTGNGTMARIIEYLSPKATPYRQSLSEACR